MARAVTQRAIVYRIRIRPRPLVYRSAWCLSIIRFDYMKFLFFPLSHWHTSCNRLRATWKGNRKKKALRSWRKRTQTLLQGHEREYRIDLKRTLLFILCLWTFSMKSNSFPELLRRSSRDVATVLTSVSIKNAVSNIIKNSMKMYFLHKILESAFCRTTSSYLRSNKSRNLPVPVF